MRSRDATAFEQARGGARGTVYRRVSGGWVWQTTPALNDLVSVAMVGASEAWAVGDSTILHWTGGECHWLRAMPPSNPFPGRYRTVTMRSTQDGWVGGADRQVLRWDGDVMAAERSEITTLNGVHQRAADDAWAVGDDGVMLHWDGVSWRAAPPLTHARFFAIDMVSAEDGWAVGEANAFARWDGQRWHTVHHHLADYLSDVDMVFEARTVVTAPGGPARIRPVTLILRLPRVRAAD